MKEWSDKGRWNWREKALLQLALRAFAGDCALNETVGVGLRGINGRVLASVFEALVPAQVNLKVVFVGKRVVNGFYQRNCGEDLIAHLVHSVLYAGAAVRREGLEGNIPCSLPRPIKVHVFGLFHSLECLPQPASLHFSAEDAVPGLRELSILIAVETMEC